MSRNLRGIQNIKMTTFSQMLVDFQKDCCQIKIKNKKSFRTSTKSFQTVITLHCVLNLNQLVLFKTAVDHPANKIRLFYY